MTGLARQQRCPENVLGWIPWYADGSLSERERGAVESHAAECADCRAELDMIAGAPFEIDAQLPDPDRAFAEITARIAQHAEENAREGIAPASRIAPEDLRARLAKRDLDADDLSRIADWVRDGAVGVAFEADSAISGTTDTSDTSFGEPAPSNVVQGPWSQMPAFRAAAAVLLVSLGALAGAMYTGSNTSTNPGDVYESASAAASANTPGTSAASEGGALIDVVFRDSTTAAEIATALREVEGEIVSGPTRLGVYRVRLTASPTSAVPDGATNSIDLDVALARLKASGDGVAIFAEAVP